MGQLSANSPLVYEVGETNNLPIKASTEIFLGSAVSMVAGYARQLTVAAGEVFAGFADGHVNNSVATDGANTIPVRRRGTVLLTLAAVAVTDIGATVYATDGATFTLAGAGAMAIGTVFRYVSSTTAIVAFNSLAP